MRGNELPGENSGIWYSSDCDKGVTVLDEEGEGKEDDEEH
jgi:hypothetical protein